MRIWERFVKRSGLILVFIAGVVCGYTFSNTWALGEQKSLLETLRPIRLSDSGMPLIRPLVAYEIPEASMLGEYGALKDDIEDVINSYKRHGNIRDTSVYYRSLRVGRWIGIEQNAEFHPASLLKIPVMIAYYKQAESEPGLLSKRVQYRPISGGNVFEARSALQEGAWYSIEDLIERMIIDSDNGATFTLLELIDENILREVYTDIGIEDPGDDSATYRISTKTYALFFRILYNANYLSPAFSEKALELLTKTTYKNGLAAGIPGGTVVAHKFGEHISEGGTPNGVELHDCGIVYHPNSHYALCIMTHAEDVSSAEALIQDISKTVYEREH